MKRTKIYKQGWVGPFRYKKYSILLYMYGIQRSVDWINPSGNFNVWQLYWKGENKEKEAGHCPAKNFSKHKVLNFVVGDVRHLLKSNLRQFGPTGPVLHQGLRKVQDENFRIGNYFFLLNGSRVSGKLMDWFQSISIMILIDISIDDRPTDRLSVCNSLDKVKLCVRNNSIGSSASR